MILEKNSSARLRLYNISKSNSIVLFSLFNNSSTVTRTSAFWLRAQVRGNLAQKSEISTNSIGNCYESCMLRPQTGRQRSLPSAKCSSLNNECSFPVLCQKDMLCRRAFCYDQRLLSQSAILPIGGYSFPSFSMTGVQVHRSDTSMGSMTMGTWLPQPHQVDFSADDVSEGASPFTHSVPLPASQDTTTR